MDRKLLLSAAFLKTESFSKWKSHYNLLNCAHGVCSTISYCIHCVWIIFQLCLPLFIPGWGQRFSFIIGLFGFYRSIFIVTYFIWKVLKTQGKTSSTEDDLNRWWPQWRRPQWKITYIEDELIGRWIQWKMTLTEDDFNGSMVWLIFADWNFEALPDGQMDGLSSKNAEAYCTLVFVSLFGEHCNLWAGFINYIFTEATWAQYNMI